MMCSNKKAAFRRPGQYVKKMHNSSDDVRLFLAIPTIIVEHAFETNYRKMLLHLYLCRRESRAGVHLDRGFAYEQQYIIRYMSSK
jgi:hypothetical protein